MDVLVFGAIIFRWKMPNIRENDPREPQVLMSGIEVDGWQLFLKEVWGLPGGAGQLWWDKNDPNLDIYIYI